MRIIHNKSRGFSLMELLVVMAIFVMVSSSIVFNYRDSTRQVRFSTLANFIASDIRNVQSQGLATMTIDASAGAYAHGIYFTKANPNQYIIFADLNFDKQYTAAGGEWLQTTTIKPGTVISQLCMNEKKDSPNPCTPVDDLHISFKRPKPEPMIVTTSATLPLPGIPYADAEISLTTSDGDSKTIFVWKSGQISIE